MQSRNDRCATHPREQRSHRWVVLSWLLLLWVPNLIEGRVVQQPAPPFLALGQKLEQEMPSGATHRFQIVLAAEQFCRVTADQRGLDFILKLFSPTGQLLLETDSLNSTQGFEIAGFIAEQAGNYRLELVSTDKTAPPGRYELVVETLRPATDQDRQWMAAQQAYTEGYQLYSQGKAASLTQAMQKFAEALRVWQVMEDQLMVNHTLNYLADSYRQLGQTQQALFYLTNAFQVLRTPAEQREAVTTLISLANLLLELGEQRKAVAYYEQVLPQWRALGDIYGEARTLINLGLASTQLGEPHQALQHLESALTVWKKLGDRLQTADTLNNIGLTYDRLGDWQQALDYYTQARTLYLALANRRGAATVMHNLGLIYERFGELSRAVEHYQQALSSWRGMGDKREEANTLSQLGFAEAQQNHLSEASGFFLQALKLTREAGDRRGEALVLQRLGDLQASTNDAAKALEYYQQALPLLRNAGDLNREAYVLISLAKLRLTRGERQPAVEPLQRALAITQKTGNRAGEAQALYGLARAAQQNGQLAAALQHSEAALTNIEAGRAAVESQQLRTSYLATAQKFYEQHIDLLMQQHRAAPTAGWDARALQTSERTHARSLLEELTEARADIRQGVDAALLARERELQLALNAKGQRQLQLTDQGSGETQRQQLQGEINALEDELRQVQVRIRQQSPRYAALTQPQPLALPGIQQLLDDEAVLLEYALGETRSYLWAVTKEALLSYELPPQAPIGQAVTALNQLLTERSRRLTNETPAQQRDRWARADTQLPAAAQRLSQLILAPLAGKLQSEWANRPLLIVADGALQYIPFAMLPEPLGGGQWPVAGNNANVSRPPITGHRPPLLVNHEIISLPSASTLGVLRKELAGRQPAPKLLAVLADPVFSRQDALNRNTRGGATTTATRQLKHEEETTSVKLGRFLAPRLPFTRQEAERISALVPSGEKFKALDFQANRATALSPELGQYRYLHFATHGLLDSERPALSALVLSLVDEKGEPQDGFLRAHEIYNLQLPAELVVLSACQTGLGKEIKGEGLVGLTRGFMYAGAARVLVSLWNVNDRATAELMAHFYQQMLKEGQRPAAALRAAQLELRRQRQWQAPYYWAGFVLQGEWK
jgi:tetratricopeptide (TPR) repeat protein